MEQKNAAHTNHILCISGLCSGFSAERAELCACLYFLAAELAERVFLVQLYWLRSGSHRLGRRLGRRLGTRVYHRLGNRLRNRVYHRLGRRLGNRVHNRLRHGLRDCVYSRLRHGLRSGRLSRSLILRVLLLGL